MKLGDWLTENNVHQVDFAKEIGVHPSTLSRFLHGKRVPVLKIIQKIHDATGGKVTWKDWN